MKKYLYTLRADLIFSEPVTEHSFVLRAVPAANATQEPMRSSLVCQPMARLAPSTDGLGNLVYYGYISQRHSAFSFSSTGEVTIDASRRETEGAQPFYRNPTPLTQLKGALRDYYLANRAEGTADEVAMDWMALLGTDFRYEKGVTDTRTAAHEAWETGSGVCQDYTHILLTLLRADGIMCRYVAGLMVGEGASHAWVEYFNGSEWVGVDPTHLRLCGDEYMKISHGPDFSYCALERGIFMGNATQMMNAKGSLIEIG